MMLRYFAQLQRAPLTERRQVAIVITAVLFFIIVILWFGASLFRSAFFTTSTMSPEPSPTPQEGHEDIVSPYAR